MLTEAALDEWINRIEAAELTAVDTETTSLDPLTAELVGISLAVEPGYAAYIPVGHVYAGAPDQLSRQRVLEKLRPWLESERHAKLGQHIKYDTHIFANCGIALRGIVHDTLLESYVLESHQRHDMDSMAQRILSIKTISYDEVTGTGAKRIGFEQVAIEQAGEYAAEDADITLQLHRALYPRIAGDDKLKHIYADIELPVKVSFFGGLTIGRVAEPDYTLDRVALVASPPDLLATKLKVLLQRAERKDYLDVATLLDSGLALSDGLAAAQALYGSGFPVRECLKALVYFADGDLAELGSSERRRLEQAVLAVDGIPSLKRISWELGPSQP